MTEAKKTREPGRRKLPKSEAKGQILAARFKPEDLKAINAAAKAREQTVSQ
jgi:hypothetical protein